MGHPPSLPSGPRTIRTGWRWDKCEPKNKNKKCDAHGVCFGRCPQACLISYKGQALDEKTPLHHAEAAMSREGARLFGLLKHPVAGMKTNIGLEQELFFVPSSAYYRRPDLQMCGRTLLGREPALNQEGWYASQNRDAG